MSYLVIIIVTVVYNSFAILQYYLNNTLGSIRKYLFSIQPLKLARGQHEVFSFSFVCRMAVYRKYKPNHSIHGKKI